MHMSNRLMLLPVLMVLSIFFGGGPALADPVNCGDIIVVDTKLEANLLCGSEPGLAIDADGVTVDLNGFTISGSGLESGVFSGGFSGITIKNGSISGFQFGIYLVETADVEIKKLTFANQTQDSVVIVDGVNVNIADIQVSVPETAGSAIILYDVDGVKISNATIHGGGYGVLTVGTSAATKDFLVMNNTFAGIRNDGVGIRIVNSDSAKVFGNRIIGSDYASGCYSGIDVFELSPKANVQILNNTITGCDFGIFTVSDPSSSGINIHRNILFDNDDGIFLVGSRNSQINGNHAYLNASVGIGLFEGSIGNSILKNTASGNGAWDMAHTPDSMPNRWSGNTCSTSDGSEVDCP